MSLPGTTNVKHSAATITANANMELESVVSHEDADGDGWMEVGKQNQMIVMHTVCAFFIFCFGVMFFAFSCLLCPSFLPSFFICFFPSLLKYLHTLYTDKGHRVPNNPYIWC